MNVASSGLQRLGDVQKTKADTRFTGLLSGAHSPCLLIGTRLPQKNLHLYTAEHLGPHAVRFTAETRFTEGQRRAAVLETEASFVFEGLTPLEAFQKYASHLPVLAHIPAPLVGWNSWDYYFTAISSGDIAENAGLIASDPLFRGKLGCLIVDQGWENQEGEWYANYRFPEGLGGLASMIRARGLIPGIWTNGVQIRKLSYPAMRRGEMLVKTACGAPLEVDGLFVVDPTHPDGEAFIFDTYSRLFSAGFRIFKVDFVSALLEGDRFYDASCGPYDALRRLFTIIRRAVGPESHIIGCSYPPECGPGYVDSCRIGVDIHNQWGHVRWVLEYLQCSFWENGRLYRIDPDFLVVRGRDTSDEAETNVFNPCKNLPSVKGSYTNRWRRGPVFDRLEAETWANVVSFSGGNLILSDRLSRLNSEGRELLRSRLEPGNSAAVPLDLGEDELASLWYDGEGRRLLLINFSSQTEQKTFRFADYGVAQPESAVCDKGGDYGGGRFSISLRPHESAVLRWQ